MFQIIRTWTVTFKPSEIHMEVVLRVPEDGLEIMLRSLRLSQVKDFRFAVEDQPPQIPEPPQPTPGAAAGF